METFTFNTVELILLSVAGILFIIQLIYYFGLYNRIHVHNKAVGKEEVHFIRALMKQKMCWDTWKKNILIFTIVLRPKVHAISVIRNWL